MSAQTILNKIRAEAADEISGILTEAQKKADEKAAAILKEADNTVKKIESVAAETVAETEKRRMQLAMLDSRKSTLAAKRALIDEAFSAAKAKLLALPKERYCALIVSLIKDANGEEELLVPKKDRTLYEGGLLKQLNDALKAKGKPGTLTLSAEDAPFEGGFMLIGPITDSNVSFDALLTAVRQQEERTVAEMLFAPEVK